MSAEVGTALSSMIRYTIMIALFGVFFFTFSKNGYKFLAWIKRDVFAVWMGWSLLIISLIFIIVFMALSQVWYYLPQTNLCTMTYWTLSIALILKKDKYINPLLPPAFIGGMLFFVGGTQNIFENLSSMLMGLAIIIRHTILVVVSMLWVRVSPTYTEVDFKKTMWYMLIMVAYIAIITSILKYSTGDDKWGVYSMGIHPESYWPTLVSQPGALVPITETAFAFLGNSGVAYPWPTVVMYIVAVVFMWGMSKLYIMFVEQHETKIKLKFHLRFKKNKTEEDHAALKELNNIPNESPVEQREEKEHRNQEVSWIVVDEVNNNEQTENSHYNNDENKEE